MKYLNTSMRTFSLIKAVVIILFGINSVDLATAEPLPLVEVNLTSFHDKLAPYGTWVEVGGTRFWHPDSALQANPDWRPYYDNGQWLQTADNGLVWQSEYNWGDITFHYGRWFKSPAYGWLWAPDFVWGPAWVFWRHAETEGAIGWAPLPVGAVFVEGAFTFHGVPVGVDYDFGLGEDYFLFVGSEHFHDRFIRLRGHEYAYHIRGERLHELYHRSILRNEFRHDEHGRFINEGIGRGRIARLAKNESRSVGGEHTSAAGHQENSLIHHENSKPPETANEAGKKPTPLIPGKSELAKDPKSNGGSTVKGATTPPKPVAQTKTKS